MGCCQSAPDTRASFSHEAAVPLSPPQETETAEEHQLRTGITKFNISPKKGIAFLIKTGLLRADPASVAAFLRKPRLFSGHNRLETGLNKSRVGEYLGDTGTAPEVAEFHQALLREHLKLFSFRQHSLVDAMRVWLLDFRLPGESQMIDRIMNAFASAYCLDNPTAFRDPDTAYVLAFGIIMLNTDLYNPNVSRKMTLAQYISSHRGIDQGNDPPVALLTEYYENIAAEEIKLGLETDVVTFFSPTKEGWLQKQGARTIKTWTRRYFLLNDNCLYYFADTADIDKASPRCIIPLENLAINPDGPTDIRMLSTTLDGLIKSAKRNRSGTLQPGSHRRFVLRAASASERDEWLRALRHEVTRSPFLRLVARKKRALRRGSTASPSSGSFYGISSFGPTVGGSSAVGTLVAGVGAGAGAGAGAGGGVGASSPIAVVAASGTLRPRTPDHHLPPTSPGTIAALPRVGERTPLRAPRSTPAYSTFPGGPLSSYSERTFSQSRSDLFLDGSPPSHTLMAQRSNNSLLTGRTFSDNNPSLPSFLTSPLVGSPSSSASSVSSSKSSRRRKKSSRRRKAPSTPPPQPEFSPSYTPPSIPPTVSSPSSPSPSSSHTPSPIMSANSATRKLGGAAYAALDATEPVVADNKTPEAAEAELHGLVSPPSRATLDGFGLLQDVEDGRSDDDSAASASASASAPVEPSISTSTPEPYVASSPLRSESGLVSRASTTDALTVSAVDLGIPNSSPPSMDPLEDSVDPAEPAEQALEGQKEDEEEGEEELGAGHGGEPEVGEVAALLAAAATGGGGGGVADAGDTHTVDPDPLSPSDIQFEGLPSDPATPVPSGSEPSSKITVSHASTGGGSTLSVTEWGDLPTGAGTGSSFAEED